MPTVCRLTHHGWADRIGRLVGAEKFPLVLGGDCSILLGAALALRRMGRFGLAFLDGHSDFRHIGNSASVGAAAGEDLALVTGRGQEDLTDLEGRRPYIDDRDAVVMGIREDDEHSDELRRLGIRVRTVAELRAEGLGRAARAGLEQLERDDLDGFWIHLDVDILDSEIMPAVDSPAPGGIDHAELVTLLVTLLASTHCVGMDVTVFDPDLDPEGRLAAELATVLVTAFTEAST